MWMPYGLPPVASIVSISQCSWLKTLTAASAPAASTMGRGPSPYAARRIGRSGSPEPFGQSVPVQRVPRCSRIESPGRNVVPLTFVRLRHAVAGERPSRPSSPARQSTW
jgi:hypothetical protein